MENRFSFSNAFLHFARANGPRGFVWQYLLAYALGAVLLAAVGYMLFRPLFNIWFDVFIDVASGGSEAEMERRFVRRITEIVGWLVFSYVAMIVLTILLWSVFEAAIQRRYVREEGFRVRLGADEFRLIAVGFIWAAFTVIGQFVTMIVTAMIASPIVNVVDNEAGGALVIVAGFFLFGFAWLWIAVRLSPASAMTIRDGRITFFGAWGATRGRFWSLLGAYIVLMIVIWIAFYAIWTVIGAAVIAMLTNQIAALEQAASENNPLKLFTLVMSFDVLGPMTMAFLTGLLSQGFFIYMWAGPAALAAKTDPRGGGVAQAPDVFA
ncbi:hypothetical protein WNY37_12735 [Henriciella sp. AS95]|uniref:hypothetical protein n=1 Tax=Henriciella sp. AS95 TaxID=3135782 RepID=UPI0031718D44